MLRRLRYDEQRINWPLAPPLSPRRSRDYSYMRVNGGRSRARRVNDLEQRG